MGAAWLDPTMGLVGAALIARWSYGLIRATSEILLDRQADPERVSALQDAIEARPNMRVVDLHLWCIGHNIYAAEVALETRDPLSPDECRRLFPAHLGVRHATIEVRRSAD